MDIFFPHTICERAEFKESAVKCGFVELTAETAANVGILPADERISILLMAWKNIGNYLTKNSYNHDVGITVSWVGRCTLNLWFGREWIACAIENKTDLIEQMMKVYPTAFITMHPYSWPYMFSIYRDPWMVEYLNLNFQRMSGPDLTPVLEPKDSEFIQQEGIPLLILRMVNMFDFRMVKLVKYMCLRLLLTWQDVNSTASRILRASPNANQYIDYARHIYLLAICESNGFKDLHYTLETIQRVVHCDLKETSPMELGAQAIANGLQESNMTLTELLMAFLFKVPKLQFGNIFGAALTKYIYFITEYQLRNIHRLSSVKLSWSLSEVYSKLIQMFIMHRESSEELIKATSKLSEHIFLGLHNLTASKCAYELIKQRHHDAWHTSKITLLLTIISEEINIIQDYKYNDVQSTDELIEKEKEVAIYYRDLAKLFHKSPYLEQEAWLTTFSLHPCREFMDAVTRCGGRNMRAIKKQAYKLKVIEAPDHKTKTYEVKSNTLKEEDIDKMSQVIVPNVSDITVDPRMPSTEFLKTSKSVVSYTLLDPSKSENKPKDETKPKPKRPPRKKTDKNGPKKIESKIKEEPKNKITSNILLQENKSKEEKISSPFKRGRPIGALGKYTKERSHTNLTKKTTARNAGEKPDLAEEIFAAGAGAAENIHSQTEETIKYPAFALINSVTDTEELMKFTNYDEAYEQYTELNKILSRIKLNQTCYEDLLTLLIAPRYKRLTWAVSWKKLKKRCRVILTKDNKKRELVEQSMADANDRLTHLNIDYEKYKNKPQIDYGTIEGGYECYDTDSDDDDLKTTEGDDKKSKERPVVKKKVKQLVSSSNEVIQIKEETQNHSIGIKPYLKIENLDSSTSNLLNIIESTHLSKPVYLNKPVYFVRNPLASPASESAISLETGLENQISSRISSRRSTGEETLTSDSFEEHHWHLTTTESLPEMRQDSLEQKINISPLKSNSSLCRSFLKTETTFNIPASIKEQLEQPTMFFKSELKNDPNTVLNTCKQEYSNIFLSKQTDISEEINVSPPKVAKFDDHTSTPNQINTCLTGHSRFSPKLFEDMPEDLTMPKLTNNDFYETNSSLSNLPLNLTRKMVTEAACKTVSYHEEPRNQVEESIEKPLKKGRTLTPRSSTKNNSRKRQSKKDSQCPRKEESQDIKPQHTNTQLSTSQESLITQPTTSLKSVRIFPHNINSKSIRINPTAAVVFSSAAASYHRTPFLNVAQQEPNILEQLLSKEIKPFTGIDELFDKTPAVFADVVSKSDVELSSACKLDAQLAAITVAEPINAVTHSTIEVQNYNNQISLSTPAETSNSKTGSTDANLIQEISPSSSVFCDSKLKNSSIYKTKQYEEQNVLTCDALKNISIALKEFEKDETTTFPTPNEDIAAGESLAAITGDFSKTSSLDVDMDANVMKLDSTINALHLLDQSKNFTTESSDIEFDFKVPAAVTKPCFFMRSKQKKVISYASDWVKNITFNDKTADIIVPVTRSEKVPECCNFTKNIELKTIINEDEDNIQNKLSCSNGSTPLYSQSQSDDILYNKHIVFNEKLLDPHLKTYKNTKAACKVTDAKKLREAFSEIDELFSGNPEESNVDDVQKCLLLDINEQIKDKSEVIALELSISNILNEHSMSDSLLEKPTSHERQSSPPLASTSQNICLTPKTILDSNLQQSDISFVKAKKKRQRPTIPSTKKFDQMFGWIEMVTLANKEPVPESVDTSDTLLRLFSAQLLNQAKSIHFNYEYLREKELLRDRVNDEGINCEASILIACPGPSEDCVKLIKAFKKSTIFKGVDMSSNEVSFTSSLAKEVLGTIVKVTLNESKTHSSCCGNHFDASDVLDEFIRSRRDVNSPTFYSPTLSMKHLRNGTLADSVECLDTSLEKFIPKPGRKRTSMSARSPVKKRIRKQQSIDKTISNEPLDKANQIPLKEMDVLESAAESTFSGILNSLHELQNTVELKNNSTVDCSIVESISQNLLVEIEPVTKSLDQFPLEQRSSDQLLQDIYSTSENNGKQTLLNDKEVQSINEEKILDICVTQKELSKAILEKENPFEHNLDTYQPIDSKFNKHSADYGSGEQKLLDDSDEPIKFKAKKPNIKRYPRHNRIPIKRIQIKRNSSAYLRNKRNAFDETKNVPEEKTMSILSGERKQSTEETTHKSEERKSDNEEKSTKYSIEECSSDKAEHLTEEVIIKTPGSSSSTTAVQLREDIEEAEKFQIENSAEETNAIYISDEIKQLHLVEYASSEAKQHLEEEQLIKNENNLSDKTKQLEVNKIENSEETKRKSVDEETKQFPMEIKEIQFPINTISSEEENKQSAAKKRIVKPTISYAELDSDSDELLKSRLKIPSLKINFPSIRPVRRRLLNRSLTKKTRPNKSSPEKPERIRKKSKEIKKTFEPSKTNPSSSLNDSDDDDDKPLLPKIDKPKNEELKQIPSGAFDNSDAEYRSTKPTHRLNESDDDAPLKGRPKKFPSKKTLPLLKTKKTSKLPVRKKYHSAYSPKRPSVRIQSKFSRSRTTSLNYYALFLSDSDEDEPVKSKRRRRTPDRLWTQNTIKRKAAKVSVNKKTSQQRKLRCNRIAIKQRQSRNRLPKPKTPAVKMPVLTREDSDHTVEENIYECATMSTANETDEEACSDHRPKRRRQKVVKPMRIRCVSRRAIPTDVITESSSCSSLVTVQTARKVGSNSTSIASLPKRGRLRRKTLEKSLLMSKFLGESSSSSSPVMMNRHKRQFAAKSTSKPQVIKEHPIRKCAENAISSESLTFMEKEAIHSHNCVNFQIRLQRLTANEAILCRKPYVRLDRNFVHNYFADKTLGHKEELESEGLINDNK